MTRYGGLKKATIYVRDDGLLDVVRERATNGERIAGVANLEEAFDAIRAHAPAWGACTHPRFYSSTVAGTYVCAHCGAHLPPDWRGHQVSTSHGKDNG